VGYSGGSRAPGRSVAPTATVDGRECRPIAGSGRAVVISFLTVGMTEANVEKGKE
jgi:hypothetical protein